MGFPQLRVVTTVLVGSCVVAACADGPRQQASPDGPIMVVSTLNVWGSISEQLGGDRVRVTTVDTGADPHDYEPTAQDARAMAEANLVIVNGIGYDPWASKLLDAGPNPARHVLSVGEVLGVPADGNPHQWNNADSVHRVVDAVTAAYRQARPADAGYFDQQRTQLLRAGFADYDAAVTAIRARFSGAPVGASESLLVPLADGLHLRMLTPRGYLDAEHEEAEPSAADTATTEAQLTGRQVAVWMYDSRSTESEVLHLNDLAKTAAIPVVPFTEAIPGSAETFQKWQFDQLTALRSALETSRHGS